MTQERTIVVLAVDGLRFALPVSSVVRAVRAVEVTPVPGAPEVVLGAINVQGRVIPVVSLRRHLGRPERAIELDDHLLIARAGSRTVALLVDEVCGVAECPAEKFVSMSDVEPGAKNVRAVVKLADGLTLIPEIDHILPPQPVPMQPESLQPIGSPP
jgi:purine-binding chemotaxis protein CheW